MDQLAGQMLKIMQKRLADRLTRELSKWGDLNEESINIQNLVKDGSISLDGMTLQPQDLAGVGLRVKGGLIKQLSIKIPWKRLKKESVRVELKELFVVLGPRAVTGMAC